jgi:hypothetical protein
MPQNVEAGRRVNLGVPAGFAQRPVLVRPSPTAPVRSREHQCSTQFARDMSLEQRHAIIRQHDMPWPTSR